MVINNTAALSREKSDRDRTSLISGHISAHKKLFYEMKYDRDIAFFELPMFRSNPKLFETKEYCNQSSIEMTIDIGKLQCATTRIVMIK
jgi:hypothetical protein